MAGLFDRQQETHRQQALPLAARMRPRYLDDVAGQSHFLHDGSLFRRLLSTNRLQSVIFYGPPGTGKTSLAELINQQTGAQFRSFNAVNCGIKELREELQRARDHLDHSGQKTILFIDELHHFNKTQQDFLLPDTERGVISLIGATTQNPFFSLVPALISRSQIFEFKPITTEEMKKLLIRAMADDRRGLANYKMPLDDDALTFLADVSDGDARRALNSLEIAVLSAHDLHQTRVTLATAEASIQKKAIRYDRNGDEHYDAASALIKSIRGTDPDAAIYWMTRMLEAGEEPRFIARRLMISASEDIGNADPHALVLAVAAAQSVEMLGLPECQIPLAHVVTYLASAPKSNASYKAWQQAKEDVQNQSVQPVPTHLRDRHYHGAKQLGHGDNYQYPHDAEDGWVSQDYLTVPKSYYLPTQHGFEANIAESLSKFRTRSVSATNKKAPPQET